ncbi:MAG TPA: hypothetical protein DIW20_07970 [Rhodospirillaceae bacterium]|nr:hypothetical protein [Rhodospirillaceae bacterium]
MQVTVADISTMLSQRTHQLVRELLPRGVREGSEWCVGSCAGEPGRSMKIHLQGGKAGVWKDFSSGETGDALELVAAVLFHGDKTNAIKWSRSWLGLDGLDPARLAQRRREAEQAARKADADAILKADKMRRMAQGLWLGARSDILNSPVASYLGGRCIDIRLLPRVPGSLRYTDKCWNKELKAEVPAMVAQISNGAGEHIATHRTYIVRGEDGIWRKDKRLKDSKLSLGSFRGGFITLNRGASNKPIAKAPAGDRLILCEGIEDGLTLALACPEHRVLAGVSLGNFMNIDLPSAIQDIIIAADNDGENAQARAALDKAIARFQAQGRRVAVARSEVGKDFNDQLQARSAPVLFSFSDAGAVS